MKRSKMQLCLFILSGEHDTLPQAELCAILESEGFSYSIKGHGKRILLMEVDSEAARIATQRAGLVNHASVIAFESPSEETAILNSLQQIDFSNWIRSNSRFGVKVTRIKREPSEFDVDDLQGKIGSEIWRAMKGNSEISLTAPDVLFFGVIYGDTFFFGPLLASRDRTSFSKRRSPFRPFFVPSAIHPKIARVLVNLSRARPGKLFVDPFSGTGGLLLEAAEIGCIPVGLDIDSSMLTGSQRNLTHFDIPFHGCLADARNPPLCNEKIEAIATDPPYGRSSSAKGAVISNLIEASLESFAHILKSGGYLCFALPLEYFNKDMVPSNSFIIKETHTMRIHRSLRRHIVVLERK
ncbi:MAG: THUMP domain-containing protein [Candidatus Thorarchaeota archaeon]